MLAFLNYLRVLNKLVQSKLPRKLQVLLHNLGCTVDGTCSLDIQVGTSQINVIYSLGWQKCNEEAAKVGIDLIEGEFIEVFARTTGENKMSTCDGTDFYIKKL